MKLIVGFGNPGNQYNLTRHNFGFLALDFYAKINQLNWAEKPHWNAIVAKDEERNLLLIKPQTFYNDQGVCVKAICSCYKIQPKDILIICDDFNLPFGKIRFRERGSSGGNNGLKSVIAYLGDDFPRLRLGSGNDQLRSRIGDVDFVLSKFTDDEREQLPKILREISKFMSEY